LKKYKKYAASKFERETKKMFLSMTPKQIYKLFGTVLPVVVENDEYAIFQGESPIVLTAHVDTVFTNRIMRRKQVGADDRAGVCAIWFILQMAAKSPRKFGGKLPSVILCNHEESGCVGSTALITCFKKPPVPCNWIIALDRRGKNDAVFYDCGNFEFQRFILGHGFHKEPGSFSDISVIAPEWNVAAVNLSIGFGNEHSLSETWNFNWTFETARKVLRILRQPEVEKEFDFQEVRYDFDGNWKHGSWWRGRLDLYGTNSLRAYDLNSMSDQELEDRFNFLLAKEAERMDSKVGKWSEIEPNEPSADDEGYAEAFLEESSREIVVRAGVSKKRDYEPGIEVE
jgi:hypothetical protein